VSVWLAIVLPWLVTAYAVFGSVLPTTFGAKHGALFSVTDMAGSAVDTIKTLGSADAVSILCLAVSLPLFALNYRRRRRSGPQGGAEDGNLPLPFYHFRQSFAAVAWILLLPAFYVLSAVNVVSRYLLVVTPLVLLYGFFYFHELLGGRSTAARYGLVLALTALVMLQNQYVYKNHASPHMAAFTVGMETCLEPIGTWLREQTPPGTVIMTADVGAVGYFSGRFICDYNGIVSEAPSAPGKNNDSFTALIRARRWGETCEPAYIVHRSPVPEELKDVEGLVPVMSKPFPGLSISDSRTVYFTIYKVEYSLPGKMLTSGVQ